MPLLNVFVLLYCVLLFFSGVAAILCFVAFVKKYMRDRKLDAVLFVFTVVSEIILVFSFFGISQTSEAHRVITARQKAETLIGEDMDGALEAVAEADAMLDAFRMASPETRRLVPKAITKELTEMDPLWVRLFEEGWFYEEETDTGVGKEASGLRNQDNDGNEGKPGI